MIDLADNRDRHLLNRLKATWDDLAEIDPMWAICSKQEKQYSKWQADEFFSTGEREIEETLVEIDALGLDVGRRTALDFGCGIGRLTQALAQRFDQCYGIDISSKMIELARELNRYGDRVEYFVNETQTLSVVSNASIDFTYSSLVLQHIPKTLALKYISEFVRLLAPRGVLVFQVPTRRLLLDQKMQSIRALPRYHPRRILNAIRWRMIGNSEKRFYALSKLGLSKSWLYRHLGARPVIAMSYLTEVEIEAATSRGGGTIISSREDGGAAGPEFVSTRFVAMKAE